MSDFSTVKIEGLKELRKALREIDSKLPGEMRKASRVAANVVVHDAKSRARGLGNKHAAAIAAPAISAIAKNDASGIQLKGTGKNKAQAVAFGAEFGSRRFKQFDTYRGNQWAPGDDLPAAGVGYFFYPAIREKGAEVVNTYLAGLDEILNRHFDGGSGPAVNVINEQ